MRRIVGLTRRHALFMISGLLGSLIFRAKASLESQRASSSGEMHDLDTHVVVNGWVVPKQELVSRKGRQDL